MSIGIYKITNPKGKIYIGQSINILERFRRYNKLLDCKGQTKLYNSLSKYKPKSHKFEIIEECKIEDLNKRERYWQDYYNVLEEGLNLILTTTKDRSGKRSIETKKKISETKQGSKYNIIPKENHGNLGNIHKKGIKLSKKQKENISKSKIGHSMYNKEWKQKISNSNKGKKMNNFTKRRIIETNTGIKRSKKFKQNIKEKRSIPILQYDLEGNFIKEWESAKQAASILGFKSNANINNVCNGKLKTYKGFIWKKK